MKPWWTWLALLSLWALALWGVVTVNRWLDERAGLIGRKAEDSTTLVGPDNSEEHGA